MTITRQPSAPLGRPRLETDAGALGLRRVEVCTGLGAVVARASAAIGPVATVLLHGAAGSWTTWTPLLRAAVRSGDPLPDVVAVDLPGWGESPFPQAGIDVGELSEAIHDVVMRLGYARWNVLGHSLGGALALDLAARFPDRTESVFLVSPSGPAVLDAVRRPLRGGFRLPGFAGMLLAMRVLRGLGDAASPLLRGLDRTGLLRLLSAPLFARPRRIDRSVVHALADEIRPGSFVAASRAAAAYDESAWRGIRCPVRSVRGARDVFVGRDDARGLSVLVADFAETVLPDAGHFAAVERPAEVLRLLRRSVV
ncbi:alpha/beta fold hydrolase [Microbacterium sp. NPDC091382]|uniref:alpha/beta fold hydrolase n=1 Tax=Microbacterium sp. NPDC091382 TaxID=3364210 RepID=UPI003823D4E3